MNTGRNPNGDFSGLEFGNGLAVTGKLEGLKVVRYQIRCSICGATGQTVSQQELAAGVTPKCRNSGCGKVSTESRRVAQFDFTPDPSVRNRMNKTAETAALKQIEESENNVSPK
ncbi:hypothetical protein SBA7_880003 [Candidatus Sulfotelmatobacter sp. SbA7]|nr:hypothetical protein SBA7_880003 [Candidatus Sulfotelmatobacter sp. SbA7]